MKAGIKKNQRTYDHDVWEHANGKEYPSESMEDYYQDKSCQPSSLPEQQKGNRQIVESPTPAKGINDPIFMQELT